ncbi:11041_t:CDS:2 [Scutellospora calospora]|uniref:11041_t:CDS:1 n=1 Tax=Scutellospora calospora TaxID=85575 RepID=A0ACA9KF63_9GLOM|nr:11041_t:CDS:2 [Scutellospora calospora]
MPMSSESNDERSLFLQITADDSMSRRQLALDRIINKIGMGKFQRQMLVLAMWVRMAH